MSTTQNTLAAAFLSEFNGEIPATQKFLERLSDQHLSWKPAEKSMTAGQVALHVAQVPAGVLLMTTKDSSEVPDLSRFEQPQSATYIVATLEDTVQKVRDVLPTVSDERMHQTFKFTKDGVSVWEAPRVAVLRTIMLNHWYHHRGQLSVYLRLLGLSVPSAYGPTADER
ncbi:MAG: DinB family protein [Bdellovibrionota bacterium]